MKRLILLVVIGIVAGSAWKWVRNHEPADGGKLVVNRIWIDHLPRSERDTINVFALVSEHSIGVFQATSQWRGAFEAFRYEGKGGELRLIYPQNGDRETLRVKARRCEESHMDFCLELNGATRGVDKYYSREGWEIRTPRDIEAIKQELAAFRAQLQAAN